MGQTKLWTHWIVATSLAAVLMIGYVHSFVFTRTEGEALASQHVTDILDIKKDMREIRNYQYEILKELKSSNRP